MKSLRRRNWLLIVLLAGVVLLTLAGLGLLGAYFYLSRQSEASAGWVNPADLVRWDGVAPDLAVLVLAGEPHDRVIRAALDAGEVETAFATLAYSPLLPDALRSGHWMLLARAYRQTDPPRATVAYQAALDQVALSPSLNDVARADLSLQTAQGFAALNRGTTARLALSQAENIARYSPVLLPAQRRDLLGRVASAYQELGDTQVAAAIRSRIDAASAGPGVQLEPPPQYLPELRGTVVLPPEVVSAIAERQQAAAAVAARWLQSGSSTRAELARRLGQALLAEESARAEFYRNADELAAEDRLALLHDEIVWLTTRHRVARKAFGVSLVPEWEPQVADIQAELADVYTDLINGYGQQLDTLGPGESVQARVELLRQGLQWVRLGLFPDHAEQSLSEQLIEASRALWTRQGGVGLTIVAQDVQGQRFYLLAGADASRAPESR